MNDERCICVVHGLGGAGKTQLVLNVIESTRDRWAYIIYVDASSEEAITNTLQDFANANGFGETHEDAIDWMEAYHERWLLVFDNADDRSLASGIRQYIPRGRRGKIIITTRLIGMAVIATGTGSTFHLSSMNQEDGLALLLKTARVEGQEISTVEREAAIALLQDFGYFALAIVHAGAYMSVCSVGIAKYRDLFHSRRHHMLEHSGRLHEEIDDYGKPVYTTWRLCYSLLQGPSQRILWLMAFLHHSHIHEEIFKRAAYNIHHRKCLNDAPPTKVGLSARVYLKDYLSLFLGPDGHWDTVKFTRLMADLTSCSLIDFDQMNLAYSIHVLVQDWVRTVIPQTPEFALECTATLLSASMFGLQDDAKSFAFERQLWLHVNDIMESGYNFGDTHGHEFGFICLRMGQWNQAGSLAQKATDTTAEYFGEDHLVTWESRLYLASTCLLVGRREEAEKIGVQILDSYKQGLDKSYPIRLQSKLCLSQVCAQLGRLDEAKQLQTQILQSYRQSLGENHPETLLSMVSLAQTYSELAEWVKAGETWAAVLSVQKQLLGEENPDVLNTMNHLAIAYSFQGRYEEANQLRLRILNTGELLVWKEDHPSELASMEQFALNLKSTGRLEEASQLLERALGGRQRLLGEEHPDTLKSMYHVATAYTHLDRESEAELLLTKAIKISERKLGSEHPDTRLYRSSLAYTQERMDLRENSDPDIIPNLWAAIKWGIILCSLILSFYAFLSILDDSLPLSVVLLNLLISIFVGEISLLVK